jgi:fumarate reductase subunit D
LVAGFALHFSTDEDLIMATTKPIFWGLFAAGGTLAALLAPILILITGPALPQGWMAPEALSFERLGTALESTLFGLFLWLTIALFLWHAAHRLRVTAHDLGWFSDAVAVLLFYGIAAAGSLTGLLLI